MYNKSIQHYTRDQCIMSLFSNIQRVIYLRSVCIVYSVLHLRSMYNKSIQQYTWDQCIMSLFSTILRSVCKISIQSYNEISSYILFICHQVIVLVRLSNSFSWTESLNFCNHLVFVSIYVLRLEDGKNFILCKFIGRRDGPIPKNNSHCQSSPPPLLKNQHLADQMCIDICPTPEDFTCAESASNQWVN